MMLLLGIVTSVLQIEDTICVVATGHLLTHAVFTEPGYNTGRETLLILITQHSHLVSNPQTARKLKSTCIT